MKNRSRRTHSSKFKAKVALAAIRGDKTLAEVSQEFQVHQNQVAIWKRQAQENLEMVFEKGSKSSSSDLEVKEMHAKIGRQALEIDFLELALNRAGLLSARK